MDLKRTKKRCVKAYADRTDWLHLYDDLYTFVLPNRAPVSSTQKARSTSQVYDSTATKAAFRFAGRMERDVTPPFQRFFEIKLGPAARAAILGEVGAEGLDDAIQQTDKELETVADLVHSTFESAQFSLAAAEMYLDLFGGQGAMLMPEDEDEIIKFISVPVTEIALREDGQGRVVGVYWEKEYVAEELPNMWADAKFSKELQEQIKNSPDSKIKIVQATEWDAKKKAWTFQVYRPEPDESAIVARDDMKTSPWLTPRFYKVPGEAPGRGPGLMALPTIKTLNKVTELTLKAAAFAILGLWTYRKDRAFNPKTAKMSPGAMWAVGSNGGPFGASIERLDVPGRFDISNLILTDLREQVKQTTFDDTLPPDSGAVRSATEIVERLKRLAADLAGAYARLVLEIVRPAVQRVMDVLFRRRLISTNLKLDQLLLKIEIVSPIARAQQAQDISAIVDWLEIMLSLGGQEVMMLNARVETIFAEIGQKLGVSPRQIREPAERRKLLELVAQIIAAQQLQASGGQPPANDGSATTEGAPQAA